MENRAFCVKSCGLETHLSAPAQCEDTLLQHNNDLVTLFPCVDSLFVKSIFLSCRNRLISSISSCYSSLLKNSAASMLLSEQTDTLKILVFFFFVIYGGAAAEQSAQRVTIRSHFWHTINNRCVLEEKCTFVKDSEKSCCSLEMSTLIQRLFEGKHSSAQLCCSGIGLQSSKAG